MTEISSPRCSVGPRDLEQDSRFRGRYAKHEIFADNGRRHYPRQCSPNPLNIPEETKFSPRPLSPRRCSAAPSQIHTSTPDLFNSSSGAWSPRRRSQSPDTGRSRHSWATGVPGASPEDKLQTLQQQLQLRTPPATTTPMQGLSSSSMKEILRSEDTPVQDLAAQMALTLTRSGWSGKRCDPKRSTSPGVSAALFGCESARSLEDGLESSPCAALNDLGNQIKRRCPENQVNQISSAVGRLLAADPSIRDAASVSDYAYNETDSCANQRGRRSRAARPEELVDQSSSSAIGCLLNEDAPPTNGAALCFKAAISRKGSCLSPMRARSPFAVEEATTATAVTASSASTLKNEAPALTEIARSCLQVASLRNKAEKLQLRDMEMTTNANPSGCGNGPLGSIPKPPPARLARDEVPEREFRCDRSARHQERLLQECKDQVAAALANIVSSTKPLPQPSAMVNPLPLPRPEVELKVKTPLLPIMFGEAKAEAEVKPANGRSDRSPSPAKRGVGGA